jgi:hypothetical protein
MRPTRSLHYFTVAEEIGFHVPFSGTVDFDNAIIRDVAVITGDVEAEGHDLVVDATTVKQLHALAKKKVPVNLDHGSGIKDTCGYLTNFHIDDNKLRADWHLLRSHDETPKMLERANVMPECFGLSVKFKGGGEKKGMKKFARAEKLISVDCVTQPAANPEGLFSAKRAGQLTLPRWGMPRAKTNPNNGDPGVPTLEELLQAYQEQQEIIAELGSRLEAAEQFQQEVTSQLQDEDDDGADDQQLTDEQINALVEAGQLINDGQGNLVWADGGDAGEGDDAGDGGNANAGDGAGANAGAVAAMSAGQRALRGVIALESRIAAQSRREQQSREQHAFATVNAKIDALVEQNEQLFAALEQSEQANEELQRIVKFGGRTPAAGAHGARTVLFSQDAEEGSYEAIVNQKYVELKAADPKLSDVAARSKAIDFGVRNHPIEFREYRSRGGKIQFSAK